MQLEDMSEETEILDIHNQVTYRHIQVVRDKDRAIGFALWYNCKEDAYSFFDFIRDYFEEKKASKYIHIVFSNQKLQNHLYDLRVDISIGQTSFITDILGIEAHYVLDLRQALSEYTHIFLVTGYTDLNGNDHITPHCSYIISQIKINDTIIRGIGNKPFPSTLIEELTTSSD